MSKIGFYIFAFVLIAINGQVKGSPLQELKNDKNVIVEVVSGLKLAKLLETYPNAYEMTRSAVKKATQTFALEPPQDQQQSKTIVTYTMGYRVGGDRRVSYNAQNFSWATPQDVQLKINYPSSGTGAVVTYAEIVVNQSNDSGRAYVIGGGIGQRYIWIVVEASYTYWFNYASTIYGV